MYNVLVCDDDEAILKSIKIFLTQEGYHVLEAKNGSEVLQIIKENEIHCLILDITPEELTERFVRGDKYRNRDGNGLGLSIAENLCKAQGGKLILSIDGDLFKAQVMLIKHN